MQYLTWPHIITYAFFVFYFIHTLKLCTKLLYNMKYFNIVVPNKRFRDFFFKLFVCKILLCCVTIIMCLVVFFLHGWDSSPILCAVLMLFMIVHFLLLNSAFGTFNVDETLKEEDDAIAHTGHK